MRLSPTLTPGDMSQGEHSNEGGVLQRLSFRVLGPLQVHQDSCPLPVTGARRRALLAGLLFRHNQVVSTKYLADAAWDRLPASPASNVRTCIWALRRILREPAGSPQRLVTQPGGYLLYVEPGELDLATFKRLVKDARKAEQTGDRPMAVSLLRRALDLWRGEPLDGQVLSRTLGGEAAFLVEQRAHAIEQYVMARARLGESAHLIADLRRWVVEYPLRESLWLELMLALHRVGRQAEALDAYRRVRSMLVEEIGVEPGRALQQAHQAILVDDPTVMCQ